jgi:hypothetical protein
VWPKSVEIELRKDMGLLQWILASKIEITINQIGIIHQGTGVVGLEKIDLMVDQMKVSGLCMSISPTSSYDGCIEERNLN